MQKILILFLLLMVPISAEWNNPYPKKEQDKKIIYRSFSEKPKCLDPAISYVSFEGAIIGQIYETLFQYKYLKRPMELEPLLAEKMPSVKFVDENGVEVADPENFKGTLSSIWTLQMKKGIKYQNHPCFTKNEKGEYAYHQLKNQKNIVFSDLFDLPNPGTREVNIRDFVYQIYRLADSRNKCPIIFILEKIKGINHVINGISSEVEAIRKLRAEQSRDRGELVYNREDDEKLNPIIIDYLKKPCEGIKIIDEYTMEITLTEKYPQFKYWLAMSFFCPMPWEAIHFYEQKEVKSKNFSLLAYPVGTGPYKFEKCNRNARIILSKNENFHEEFYPKEASPELAELLKDAGKKLPLVDKLIWTREPEITSQWFKFQQGYLEVAGISEQNFSSAIDLNSGSGNLSQGMKKKKIRLYKGQRSISQYFGFNMLDPVVGGYEEEKCKLRQAISMAIDADDYIKTFLNGRGIVAHNIIAPGFFGFKEGKEGMNPYQFDWDEAQNKACLKNISVAKKLLEEAGYPNGIDNKTGKQLVLFLDIQTASASTSEWFKSQFSKLNIVLATRETDYNRLSEKYDNGNFQIFIGAWSADYPDPENFLFLLSSSNGKVKFKGENVANYTNAEYDKLFDQLKSMEDTPKRTVLIDQAVNIIRKEAPLMFFYYPIDYVIYHDWFKNFTRSGVLHNSDKYQDIDAEERLEYRARENQPQLFWPIGILLIISITFFLAAYRFFKKEIN